MHSYVARTVLVCTRILLVCYSYVTRMLLVCYSYVTRMLLVCYSYVTRMLLVCYSYVTRMLLVCYSYELVCFSYVLVCTRMSSCGVRFSHDCLKERKEKFTLFGFETGMARRLCWQRKIEATIV